MGSTPSEFREDLNTHKTRMNGLSCGEETRKHGDMFSRFDTKYHRDDRVTDRRKDGRTDGQTSSL